MRLAITVVIVCAATVARAQPSLTPPVSELPPTQAPSPVPESRTEIALHLGVAASTFDNGTATFANGSGPSVDIELGWRHRWLSLIVYGDFTNASTSSTSNSYPFAQQTLDSRYLGLGARLRFHFAGAFVGSGIGVELVHESGANAMSSDLALPVFEIDAGYTFQKIGGVQPQLLGVLEGAPFEDDTLGIARLSLGVVF